MDEAVDGLWARGVSHVEEMGDADFERRTAPLSLQDTSGEPAAIAKRLADEWDLSKSKAADRAARLFLAQLLDTSDEMFQNAREVQDIAFLIPPEGWIESFDPISIRYGSEGANLSISVPPTVRALIEDVVATDEIEIDSKADFLRVALYWVIGEIEWTHHAEEDGPSYLRTLYGSEARQELVDYFLGLDWSDDRRALSKQDIIDQLEMQRKTVIEHIDILVEFGIVNENDEGRWTRYEPAVENPTYQAVLEANRILAEYHRSSQS